MEPAVWDCTICSFSLCAECVIDENDQPRRFPKCPKCDHPLKWAGGAGLITPFWHRLPEFFKYPFATHPLLLNIFIAVSSLLFTGDTVAQILAYTALQSVLFSYGFSVIQSTAKGAVTAPEIEDKTLFGNLFLVLNMVGLILVIGFSAHSIYYLFGVVTCAVFLGAAVLLSPAMVILLIIHRRVRFALSPSGIIRIIGQTGWVYLWMLACLILLMGAPFVLSKYIVHFLPRVLHHLLFNFAQNYYTIIAFYLIGYVMLQSHEAIGFPVDIQLILTNFAPETPEDAPPERNVRIYRKIDFLIKEGRFDDAAAYIQNEARYDYPSDPVLYEKYFDLLKITRRFRDMVAHGGPLLRILIRENEKIKAYRIYSICRSLDRRFTPTPSILLKLGNSMNELGDKKAAVNAYSHFVKSYPENPNTPQVYYDAAQIYHDALNDSKRARLILQGIIERYPHHMIIPKVRFYLGNIPQ